MDSKEITQETRFAFNIESTNLAIERTKVIQLQSYLNAIQIQIDGFAWTNVLNVRFCVR